MTSERVSEDVARLTWWQLDACSFQCAQKSSVATAEQLPCAGRMGLRMLIDPGDQVCRNWDAAVFVALRPIERDHACADLGRL